MSFAALQAMGIGVGAVLSLLAWRQMQAVQHIRQVSWPRADAAMEARILFLQEELEIACAHCHWERSPGTARTAHPRSRRLELLHALDASRLAELERQRHDQLGAVSRDLEALSAHVGKLDRGIAKQHGTAMAGMDSTARQIESLLGEIERQSDGEMLRRSEQATTYAYAGLVSLGLLGVAMVGATGLFTRLMRRQVSAPLERMLTEVKAVETQGPWYRVSLPSIPEFRVLAQTLNQALARLEAVQAERRQLDRNLIQAERLASVGVVAAGIVHNLRSPLTIVMGYGQTLRNDHPELSEPGLIVEAARQMNLMIEGILARGRTPGSREPVDLNHLLLRELDFLQADLVFKHQVETELRLADGLTPVECRYADLSQVFGNLLRNAVDAMRDQERKQLRVATCKTNGDLTVEVTDTGCGIPAAILPRLFEPFFTTKGAEKGGLPGTGLGLYTAHRLLEPYRGAIEVESAVGRGTTFRVRIPLGQGPG